MVVGCPSIFNKLNSPLAKLPYKKFYKEVHKDIYLNFSVMWASVSQILQELRFAQILVCVCLELCLMLCQTKNYSNVCSWECVFCSCWFPAHTPQGYKAPLTLLMSCPFPSARSLSCSLQESVDTSAARPAGVPALLPASVCLLSHMGSLGCANTPAHKV